MVNPCDVTDLRSCPKCSKIGRASKTPHSAAVWTILSRLPHNLTSDTFLPLEVKRERKKRKESK